MCTGGCRTCGVITNLIFSALAFVALAAALGGASTDDNLENVPWAYAEVKGSFGFMGTQKSETWLGLKGSCVKSTGGDMKCDELKPKDFGCDNDNKPDFCDCVEDDNVNGQTGAAALAFLGGLAALALAPLRIEKCDGCIKKILGISACLFTVVCGAAALGVFAQNCYENLKDVSEKALDIMQSGTSTVYLAQGWWLELIGCVLALVSLIINAVLPIGVKA